MRKPAAPTQGVVPHPKYHPLMQLGQGGMGVVHLAMARGPRGFVKLVVLKMLKRQLVGDVAAHRMFLDEARISARLNHPNIVQTYEVTAFDDVPTIVLEYLDGQPLSSIVDNVGRLWPRGMYLTILVKVLAGLHAAHDLKDFDGTPLGLVHRDVSPHNVFVLFDGQVKVLDFGIAKAEGSTVETQTGMLKGKVRYMAPEQLGGEKLDRRVDVFAVGVMMWEALVGERLWGDLSEGDVMRALLSEQVPPLPDRADIAPELAAICQRALEPNPANRYASAGDFQRELEQVLACTNQLCAPDEVGAFLHEHFAEVRQATNRVIESHIKVAEESLRPPAPSAEETTAALTKPGLGHRVYRPKVWAVAAAVAAVVLAAVLATVIVRRGGSAGAADNQAQPRGASAAGAQLSCGPGFKLCDAQCVSIDRPDYGCGAQRCSACLVPNATPRCNNQHECDIAVCYQAYDNCDGKVQNGCETNVRIDPDHCGGCNRRCPELAHAERGCGDVCTIWRCQPGYRDCNGVVSDGCEQAVTNDRNNCGHCGAKCRPGQVCRAGRCEP